MMSSLSVHDNCIEEDLMSSNEWLCHNLSTSALRMWLGVVVAAHARRHVMEMAFIMARL